MDRVAKEHKLRCPNVVPAYPGASPENYVACGYRGKPSKRGKCRRCGRSFGTRFVESGRYLYAGYHGRVTMEAE